MKCKKKPEISRAKRAKQLFFKIEYVNLSRSYLRRGRGYLISILLHPCHSKMFTSELQFLRIDSFTFLLLHSLNYAWLL